MYTYIYIYIYIYIYACLTKHYVPTGAIAYLLPVTDDSEYFFTLVEVYGGAHLAFDGPQTSVTTVSVVGDDTGYIHLAPQQTLKYTEVSQQILSFELVTSSDYRVVVLILLSLTSGGQLAMVTVIFSSSFLSSRHFSLTKFSINSLQLLLSFAVVLHSPPTLSRSLLT